MKLLRLFMLLCILTWMPEHAHSQPAAASQFLINGNAVNGSVCLAWNGTTFAICGTTGTAPTNSGTMTQTSVNCGTSSTPLLSASAATQFISVKSPAGTNTVWVNWAGAAAVAAPPSEDLAVGGKITWTAGANGFLPTSAISCIATVATTVTVEYK